MTLTFDPRSPNSIGPSQGGKQPFSENRVQIGAFVRLDFCSQEVADTQTDRQTHTQTNCSENITPPRFRGGVIIKINEILIYYVMVLRVKIGLFVD